MAHRDGNIGLVLYTSARGAQGGEMVEENVFVAPLGVKKDGKLGESRERICSRYNALTNTYEWGRTMMKLDV